MWLKCSLSAIIPGVQHNYCINCFQKLKSNWTNYHKNCFVLGFFFYSQCCPSSWISADTVFTPLRCVRPLLQHLSVAVCSWVSLPSVLASVTKNHAILDRDRVTVLAFEEYPISLLWETIGLLSQRALGYPFALWCAVWSVLHHLAKCVHYSSSYVWSAVTKVIKPQFYWGHTCQCHNTPSTMLDRWWYILF